MSRKANAFSFARTIADKRQDIVRARETVTALASQADAFAPAYAVANTIAKFCKAQGFGQYVYANPSSWGPADNCLSVSIDDTVTSLREGAIPTILEYILSMGFDSKDTKDYLDTSYAFRSFRFTTKIGGVELNITIEANIKEGSDSCKRVQTGVEIKEVAKFEIVCA